MKLMHKWLCIGLLVITDVRKCRHLHIFYLVVLKIVSYVTNLNFIIISSKNHVYIDVFTDFLKLNYILQQKGIFFFTID